MTKDLNLPTVLLDQSNISKMLTLLFPCSTRKKLKEGENMAERYLFA